MEQDRFDVIVVGSGAAGLCGAAELTLRGARTLLISETSEVGYMFRSLKLGNSRGLVHHPTRNLYGEGGYWFSLCRKLNVPVTYHLGYSGLAFTVEGSGVVTDLPMCASASALAAALDALSPVPLGDAAQGLERILHAGLTIPIEELTGLQHVLLVEWLEKEGADALATVLTLTLGANLVYLSAAQAAEHLSVFGLFFPLRGYLCGEVQMCTIEPDAREGLFIPLGRAIEGHGGVVWRGRRVGEVLIEDGAAVGVALDDGREARAPVVALAVGTPRLQTLLRPLPPEVEPVAAFEAGLGDLREYTTLAVTEGVTDRRPGRAIMTVRADGSQAQANWSVSSWAPWCTPPGTQLIGEEVVRSAAEVEAAGGEAAMHAEMHTRTEAIFPGYGASILEFAATQHPQLVTPFLTGPRLPRRSPSIDGLWYVGDNSLPVDGCYVEGAASAGVLGARDIAAQFGR